MTERGEWMMVEVKWSSNGIIRNDNTNVFDVRTFFLNFVRAVPTRTGLRCYSRHYYQTILISWLCVSRRKCSNYEHIAASKNIPNDMETKTDKFCSDILSRGHRKWHISNCERIRNGSAAAATVFEAIAFVQLPDDVNSVHRSPCPFRQAVWSERSSNFVIGMTSSAHGWPFTAGQFKADLIN